MKYRLNMGMIRAGTAAGLLVSACGPLAAASIPDKTVLFQAGQDGFTLYRIPGIVVTPKGTVLAYW